MMCSAWTEQYVGLLPFIRQRCEFALVMAASPAKVAATCAAKGWEAVSAYSVDAQSDFGHDYGVSFTPEQIASKEKLYNYGKSAAIMSQMHGFSVFRKDDDGAIYHTYSTYSAGLSELSAPLKLFDILPDGRAEKRNLDWIKHREDYDK